MNNRAIQNLTLQLQKSLDTNYDVVDMQTVLYVIQQLENTTITKEQLETTRLAKYINELRRRTSSETLARRAKSLLKKWRDIFMPAIQQQSVPTPTTAGIRSDASGGAPSINPAAKQQQPPAASNTFLTHSSSSNKGLTGSANNNSNNKSTNNLSNGGFNQHQHQSLPMESKLDMLRPRGTRIVSPMMCPISGSVSMGSDRKTTHPSQSVVQPTSFANVLGTTQPMKSGSASNPSVFSHFRPDSPLPHITQNVLHPRRRRSPTSILDFDSNSSRPLTTPGRSKAVVNGEHATPVNAPSEAGDLHDCDSVALDIAEAGAASAAVEEHQPGQVSRKMYSTIPASLTAADICSSSSSHRKSKKHKKEKKRNKQSPDKPPPTSEIALQASQPKPTNVGHGSVPFLNPYGGETQPIGEEETHNTVVAGTVFPHHDSLSSSSMSRFPSNISTNTMTMQHNIRVHTNNEAGPDNMEAREESDLTFAGKFKSSCSAGLIVADDTIPVLKKSYSDSKDSSDVVVVESRSCSPFTTMQMGVDDSCSSSSRATMTTETINLNPDSIQDTPIDMKIGLSQRTVQPIVTQQDPGLSCNSTQAPIVTGVTTAIVPEQQPVETVAPAPKKRGRKKGSRGFDAVIAQTQAFLSASMFERPKMLLGSKKVKTTKELLADIQNRKLGSSATSSPTLISRQSVSPSTCSEASFQSDLTSTRASMPNPRLSPELLGTATNCRQSDIDDATSATESNDAAAASKLRANSTIAQNANKSATSLSSIDEYLKNLVKLLPLVDRTKLENFNEPTTVVCTCTVRETEPDIPINKEEVVIIQTDNEDDMKAKDVPFDVEKTWPNKPCFDQEMVVPVSNGSALEPPISTTVTQIVKKSPKKPIKSIFDLDYDEENDPLHSFVEQAKLRVSETVNEEKNSPDSEKPSDATGIKVNQLSAADSQQSSGISTLNQEQELSTGNLPPISTPKPVAVPSGEVLENSPGAEANAPSLPLYEAVEDVNCPAKYRYDVQTNCITEHHINILHNCFVPNVNGNWSGAISMTSDHSKKLRKYLSNSKQGDPLESADIVSSQVSWWVDDMEFQKSLRLETDSSNEEEHLFERVVPHYDHIIMDKVIKNLSHVKFTKNYMKKKLKRLKIEEGKTSLHQLGQAERDADCSYNTASENRKVKKRKRTRTLSANNDSVNEDGDADKKHKHPRRRKHRKIRDNAPESSAHVDISLSRNDVKDPIDELILNSINCDVNIEDEMFSLKDTNPNRYCDAENTCSAEISQQTIKLQLPSSEDGLESSIVDDPTANLSHSTLDVTVHHTNYQLASTNQSRSDFKEPGQDDSYRHNCELVNKTDDHIREPNAADTEIIESFAYLSNIPSNVNNSSDTVKDNQLLPTVVTPILHDDEGSNSRGYSCNSGESIDHYGNQDVDEEYGDGDDYFEDDHLNNEEHEVVTHDMTSSTSTTSQQHIVLTIKKKIPKSASSHAYVDGNNECGAASPRGSSVNSEQDGDQLSIVTSSSTPTTITIRRKNKQQKRKQQIEKSEDQHSDINIRDINANNNVKNGNAEAASGDSEAASSILFEASDMASQGETRNFPSTDPENISDSGNINHTISNDDDVITLFGHVPESLSSPSPKTEKFEPEISSETQMCGEATNNGIAIATSEETVQKCGDPDLSDNEFVSDDEKAQLPKENNSLLESFNELSDDNSIGLRVLQKPIKTEEQITPCDASNGVLSSVTPSANVPDESYMVQEFKEWHEVLQVPSYNEEILTILPYVVID